MSEKPGSGLSIRTLTVKSAILQELFGRSDQYIRNKEKEGIVAKASHGNYFLWRSAMAYISHLQARVARKGGGDYGADDGEERLDLQTERARLVREQFLRERRLNELAEGELLNAEAERKERGRIMQQIALFLDTLPDVVEREAGLTPAQAQAMQDAIDRQRDAFYQRELAAAEQQQEADNAHSRS